MGGIVEIVEIPDDETITIITNSNVVVENEGTISKDMKQCVYTQRIVLTTNAWDNLVRALDSDHGDCIADNKYPVRISRWGYITELRQSREVSECWECFGYVRITPDDVACVLNYQVLCED
jgi:ABC-type amino acid transport substrate-binding protein